MSSRARYPVSVREGVTLIELLVVVAVLSLLIALALPGLASARRAGRAARCWSNIGQSAKDIAILADQRKEQMPALRLTKNSSMSWREPRGRISCSVGWVDMPYFGSGRWWSSLLASELGETSDAWNCPGVPHVASASAFFGAPFSWQVCDQTVIPSTYFYSLAFVAQPSFWKPGAPQTIAELRPQLLSSVAAPSAKVVLFEGIIVHRTGMPESSWSLSVPAVSVAFADLHVATKRLDEAIPGVVNRFQPWTNNAMLHTENGIHGRDFR